jgi:hypothetical protein
MKPLPIQAMAFLVYLQKEAGVRPIVQKNDKSGEETPNCIGRFYLCAQFGCNSLQAGVL